MRCHMNGHHIRVFTVCLEGIGTLIYVIYMKLLKLTSTRNAKMIIENPVSQSEVCPLYMQALYILYMQAVPISSLSELWT